MRFMSRWLVISSVLLCPVISWASTHGGGLLTSNSSGGDKDTYEVESLVTTSFGVFHRYTLSDAFSLQTEFLYAHKGAKGKYDSNEAEIHIWHVDMAPLLQYRILDGNCYCTYLYPGPIFGLRLDANIKTDFNDQSNDIKSSIRRFDWGFTIVAKFALPRGSNEFGVDVRYTSGFISPDETSRDIDLKNSTITVMLEMYFGKG